MQKSSRFDRQLARLTTRISMEAWDRVQQECVFRENAFAARVPMGAVITDLVMKHLPPVTEAPGSTPPPIVGGPSPHKPSQGTAPAPRRNLANTA